MFIEATASRDGGVAGTGEVVAIGGADAFDHAELAQPGEVSVRVVESMAGVVV